MKPISRILHLLVLASAAGLFAAGTAAAQTDSARFRIYMTQLDSGLEVRPFTAARFGVHPQAQFGYDGVVLRGFTDHWFENEPDTAVELGQFPGCGFGSEIRLNNMHAPVLPGLAGGQYINIHPFRDTLQVDSFRVSMCLNEGFTRADPHPQIFTWPLVLRYYCDSLKFVFDSLHNGVYPPRVIDMLQQAGMTLHPDIDTQNTGDAFGDPIHSGIIIMYGPKIPPGRPAVVTLLAPANGDTNRPAQDTLRWGAVPGAFFYKVQVSTNRNFTGTLFYRDSMLATSAALPALTPLQWYYWRVLVSNAFGFSLYQNPVDSFRAKLLPPDGVPAVFPGNAATNVSRTPVLRWRRAPYAPASYQIQLSTKSDFSAVIIDTTGVTDTTLAIADSLQNCRTYYWRVKGTNYAGTGPYGGTVNFRVLLATPGQPVLLSYADNAVDVPQPAVLTWTGRDVCTDNYQVLVYKDSPTGTLVTPGLNANDTTASLNNLLGLTTYFWKIAASNASKSDTSVMRQFTTALYPPAVPALVSPAVRETVHSVTAPRFTWTHPLNNPAGYHLQVSSDSTFTNLALMVVNDSTSITDTSAVTGPLNGCSAFFWRVRAKNAAGSSAFAAARKFFTTTVPPDAPVLVSPPDGQQNVGQFTTLTWNAAGTCPSTKFIVKVSTDTSFTPLFSQDTVSVSSDRVGPLAPNTLYNWRVTALNGSGIGGFASRQFRTTALTPPDTPHLRAPANGLAGVPLTPTLIWDTTARAATYKLQVAYDTGFAALALTDSTLTQPSRQVGPLLNNLTYYWRVRARNDSGFSPYSERWAFVTLAPPGAPTQVRPVNGDMQVAVTPQFLWSEPEGATLYHLQVSQDSVFTNFFENDSSINSTSHVMGGVLREHRVYYWRIRAKNGAGWGAWSPREYFRTVYTSAANWIVPLFVCETGPACDSVYFGLNPLATPGIDTALGEFPLPPPSQFFDARFIDAGPVSQIGDGLHIDVLPFVDYSQRDTFRLKFQPGTGSYPMRISWSASFIRQICDSMLMVDELGGAQVHKWMQVDSSVSISNVLVSSVRIIGYGANPVLQVRPVPSAEIPRGFSLDQNYPNPFNPSTRVRFSTEWGAHIVVTVFDLLGRRVASLVDGDYFPGAYTVEWDGTGESGFTLPSGIYYLRMNAVPISGAAGDGMRFQSTRKMMLLR